MTFPSFLANMFTYKKAFIMIFRSHELSIWHHMRYSASKISVSDLDLHGHRRYPVSDLDLSDSLKVKYFNFVGKSMCYFIMIFYRYESHYLQDIPHLRIRGLMCHWARRKKVKVRWRIRLVIHIFLEFFWHNFCVFFKIILENNKKVRLKLLQIICIYDIIMQSI